MRWYNRLSFETILKDAASLPPHSAIFWHLMSVDAAGVAHEANTALSRLSAAANAPVFPTLTYSSAAIVGGSMHSVEEGGAVSGRSGGEAEGGLRAVLHQQSGRHGHGVVDCPNHCGAHNGRKTGMAAVRRFGSGFLLSDSW